MIALLLSALACQGPTVDGPGDTGVREEPCADLDCDGWPDLVVSSSPSAVFWGSEGGFSQERSTRVSTVMPRGSTLADLDRDGDLDLVVTRMMEGPAEDPVDEERETESYLFYTVSTDPWEQEVVELPTIGAHGVAVADLDADGWPDIAFANIGEVGGLGHEVPSYVYWGSPGGFSERERASLATVGAYSAAAHDLDGDAWPDLVFTQQRGTVTWDWYPPVLVLWSEEGHFGTSATLELPAEGASGLSVGDLDLDGDPDLAWADFKSTPPSIAIALGDGARGFELGIPLAVPSEIADGVSAFPMEGMY